MFICKSYEENQSFTINKDAVSYMISAFNSDNPQIENPYEKD